MFGPQDTVYVIAELANAPDDTVVKMSWFAVDVVTGFEAGELLDEAEITFGIGNTEYTLTRGYVVLTAVPSDNAFLIVLEIQLVSSADSEAFDNILASFVVNPG